MNYIDTGVPEITSHESNVVIGSGLLVGIICLTLYLIPTIIAFSRDHDYKWIIAVINIVLGMTILAYVAVLVWSIWPSQETLTKRRYRFSKVINSKQKDHTFAMVLWSLGLFVFFGATYYLIAG